MSFPTTSTDEENKLYKVNHIKIGSTGRLLTWITILVEVDASGETHAKALHSLGKVLRLELLGVGLPQPRSGAEVDVHGAIVFPRGSYRHVWVRRGRESRNEGGK